MNVAIVSQFPPAYGNQKAGSNRPYEIDVSSIAVDAWQANISIAASALIRPTSGKQTGFVYRNGVAAGQTGSAEPNWPNSAGATVQDGSLTWTAVAPPSGGEDAISNVTWAQVNPPDATLTITGQVQGALNCSAFIGGGTSAQTYEVLVTVTMTSGAIYKQQIYVTIL